jgi:hypothetical protein
VLLLIRREIRFGVADRAGDDDAAALGPDGRDAEQQRRDGDQGWDDVRNR